MEAFKSELLNLLNAQKPAIIVGPGENLPYGLIVGQPVIDWSNELPSLKVWNGVELIEGLGEVGPEGPQGPAGADGSQGIQGVAGAAGADGAAGAAGATGVQGASGLSYQVYPRSGNYVLPAGTGNATSGAMIQSRCYVFTIALTAAATALRLALEVTTAVAATVVRLGLYADDNGWPGNLILDAGTIDASTTGVKEIVISQNLLENVTYWIAGVSQGGAATVRMFLPMANHPWTTYLPTPIHAFLNSNVTGALPSPFGTPTGQISGASSTPIIRLKF